MLCVAFLVLGLVYYSKANVQMSGSAMIFQRVKTMTFSSDINLMRFPGQMVAYHQWNHVYSDNTKHFITKLGAMKVEKSTFTIELEKFDNNTEIYNLFKVYNASNGDQLVLNLTLYGSGVERKFIHLVDDGYYEYRNDEILKQEYYSTKQFSFSCREYSDFPYNVQIGWINTVNNKIFFYNQVVETNLSLSAEHNGTMLCCIYYTLNEDGKNIRRVVKNKILLIHQIEMSDKEEPSDSTTKNSCERRIDPETTRVFSENVNETNSNTTKELDKNLNTAKETSKSLNALNEMGTNFNDLKETGKNSNATNESDKKSNATKETDKNTNATKETDKNTNATKETDKNTNENTNATNETDTNSKATNITRSNSDQDLVSSHNFPIAALLSVISASIVILLVISIIFIRRRREVDRRDRTQRPLPPIPRQRPSSEFDPNSPFYLNMLFRRECQLEIQAREEPQYEEVMYQQINIQTVRKSDVPSGNGCD